MDPKVIWSLDQTWAEEEKWYLGSVEVTPIEAAEKPQYSVRSQDSNLSQNSIFLLTDCCANIKVWK